MREKANNKSGKKKRNKRHLFAGKCLVLAVIVFFLVLFYVWKSVEQLDAGFLIREREMRRDNLIEAGELLRSEVIGLKSPQRLERIAKEDLGLIVPVDGRSIRRIVVSHQSKK